MSALFRNCESENANPRSRIDPKIENRKSKRDKNKCPQLKFENRNSKFGIKNASSQKSKIEDSKVLKIKESIVI